MNLLKLSRFLLILILPVLIFLGAAKFAAFDGSYYEKKFLEYGLYEGIPQLSSIHNRVIDFIKGKNNELPDAFNEREKQHLADVRGVVRELSNFLYFLIVLFLVLSITSIYKLKNKKRIINFLGGALFYSGLLTITVSVILFLLIIFDFAAAFESFHMMFFEKGSYIFDPSKEMLVRIYPEDLFMDLGLRIMKFVLLISLIIAFTGKSLITKNKKNKNKSKLKT